MIIRKQAWPWIGSTPNEMGSMDQVDKDVNSQNRHDTLVPDKSLAEEQVSSITYENGIISPVEGVSNADDDLDDKKKIKKADIDLFNDDELLASFSCNLAKSYQDKIAGLQPYDSLDEAAGLLFEYQKPEDVLYHMGTVKFPIDIIFVSPDNKIKKICKNIQPGTLGTFGCAQIKYVLEVCGGLSDRLEITPGVLIKINNENISSDNFNKISRQLGITKSLIIKHSSLGTNKISNWKSYPILDVNNNLNKTAKNMQSHSNISNNFKPEKKPNIAVFDFDGLIEKSSKIKIYQTLPLNNYNDSPHLTTDGDVVKLSLNDFGHPIYREVFLSKTADLKLRKNESLSLTRSLSDFMNTGNDFNEVLDLFYKMSSYNSNTKLVVVTRHPNINLIQHLLSNKIKLHLGKSVDFEIMSLTANDDATNILEKVALQHNVKKIEIYSDNSILKRAGTPVPDETKQKARRIYKLLDSAATLIENSLENMKKNVSEYEAIKDDAVALKSSKGQYNQSIKNNTRLVREFLIKIRDAIKAFNEIKDSSTTTEIINGLTSSTKIVSDAVEGIFDLIEELENPDFYMTLSSKVKDYEKNIEDLQYSLKRAINYINTDILGLVILSD